jgi:hypothetical protein
MADFRCRYSEPEVRRRSAQHLVHRTIFDVGPASSDIFVAFADYATHNLTLATTRYLIDTLKGAVKARLMAKGDAPVPRHEEERGSFT